ncbi:MAG: pyridoxal phosphate-dependent aminotransferase [Acidobacteriota bacterium]
MTDSHLAPVVYLSKLSRQFPVSSNALYQVRDELLLQGVSIQDLVSGNVTQHGMLFPQERLISILQESAQKAQIYHPDSFGQSAARMAISEYYADQGVDIPADQIVLTPGTSISYFYCFKLLADPGDEILAPTPSYPLFETVARLCDVQMTSYRLQEADHWAIDLDYLESQVTTKTRALVLISPHNPTGAVAGDRELKGLVEIAARHRLGIIADEVFSPFLFGLNQLPRPARQNAPLVFTLNGFSKMLALPGIKLGWIGVSGEAEAVRQSLRSLEMISDTFLPVNEAVQFAVPGLLEVGRNFVPQYASWVRMCRDTAVEVFSSSRVLRFVAPVGGFHITVQPAGGQDEERLAIRLLREAKILVHPGYFYDIDGSHLVLSFVHEPAALRRHLLQVVEAASSIPSSSD